MRNRQIEQVTQLLMAWRRGDSGAEDRLMSAVYDDLRRIAAKAFAAERSDHTLTPTAVAHEAYFRLIDQKDVDWKDRAHFFAIASRMIRRILIDHAREGRYQKRGGGVPPIRLDDGLEIVIERPDELLALDAALQALARRDPLKHSIVELRFFGGLTAAEIAEVLKIGVHKVNRQWRLARAWLFRELRADKEPLR